MMFFASRMKSPKPVRPEEESTPRTDLLLPTRIFVLPEILPLT
jgi:hypothetical protein